MRFSVCSNDAHPEVPNPHHRSGVSLSHDSFGSIFGWDMGLLCPVDWRVKAQSPNILQSDDSKYASRRLKRNLLTLSLPIAVRRKRLPRIQNASRSHADRTKLRKRHEETQGASQGIRATGFRGPYLEVNQL